MSQNDLNKIDLVIIISTIPGVPLAPGWFDALNSLPVVILGHFRHARNGDFHPKSSFSGMSEMTKYDHQYRVQLFSWFQYGFKAPAHVFLEGAIPIGWLIGAAGAVWISTDQRDSTGTHVRGNTHVYTCMLCGEADTSVWKQKHLMLL